ncbi:PAZ domain-containing protein, partial [Schizophyllum fasciatum]
ELCNSIGGIALRVGYFQSVRPTVGRLLVNIDQALAAFYASGHFHDVAQKVLDSNRHSAPLTVLRRHFYKVKVNVPFLAKQNGKAEHIRVVHDIIEDAGGVKFDLNGTITTVYDYFCRTHQYRLENQRDYGVVVSPKNSKVRVVIPAELCYVCEDQFYRKRLNEEMTGAVLKLAKKEPENRKTYICSLDYKDPKKELQTPLSSYEDSPYIREAGMEIASQMAEVQGKLLQAPQLAFHTKEQLPFNGSWNLNEQRTYRPARTITHFVGINYASGYRGFYERDVKAVFNNMRLACKNIVVETEVAFSKGNMDNVESALEAAYEDICLQELAILWDNERDRPPPTKEEVKSRDVAGYCKRWFLLSGPRVFRGVRHKTVFLVLVPPNCQEQYDAIKHWGDITRGVTTQVLCMTSVDKWYDPGLMRGRNDRFPKNVAIKINARLGGINWKPDASALHTF